jgi:hypothetical protein
VTKTADTPAGLNLFEVDEMSPELDDEARKLFHSQVAKLLYMAKRVRVDMLLPVNFLCTRVKSPTADDLKKLNRVHRYLLSTKDYVMRLGVGDEYVFTACADASYGVHIDGKSHSALTMTLGGGTIMAKSSKQSIVTKSSTEAEVVAGSDGGTELIAAEDFLVYQGFQRKPAVLFQDNMSAISLLKNGKRSSDKTKHMNIRYFWIKDRVESGEMKIVYLPTESMWADLLTKPLQGELFKKF